MKSLVIAEKPSVGKDIARVLGCRQGGNGFLEGNAYIVTWALGHLVTLSDPEDYGDQWKDWKMETLPMLPEILKTEVIKKTSRQYNIVKSQLHRKDVGDIIIATDAGREGELVARWIIEKSGTKKPLKRLWISSVTDKAIKDGFAHLKNGHAYDHLYEAALARAEADWLVGLNASRALTIRHNAQLSCGRVQTPTLAIIRKQSDVIKNFKVQTFYQLTAVTDKLRLLWVNDQDKSYRTFDKEKAAQIKKAVDGKEGQVIQIAKQAKKSYSPALYDLTELQRDANRLYGFSAKETLNFMQRLYEYHKALTYPRTDSRYITQDMVDTLSERVKACRYPDFTAACAAILKSRITTNKSFVDNQKVTDHHAIIPTELSIRLNDLEYGERKIYELVIRRFLAVLMPPFEYEQTDVTVKIGDHSFAAKGRHVTSPGYRILYEAYDDENEGDLKQQMLPTLNQGQRLKISAITITEGKTQPPAPFTEATLLSAMENPVKYMESTDPTLKKMLGETGGLGTVATRADIIEKLFNSFMMEKKGQHIYLTSKGRQVLELAPKALCSPELTARWEKKLSDIAAGRGKKQDFEAEIRSYTVEVVGEIKASSKTYKHDNITTKRCPECGKLLLEVNHKNGRMLVCQDRECSYRKSLSRVTNARCPKCHKKMEMVGEGVGKLFSCGCGFRESMEGFEKRKAISGGNVSKKDVANYLNQQKKEAKEPVNNALAEALAKLKL